MGRLRPAPSAVCPRTAVDRSARLFLCVRCRQQVVLCSHCDHGQVYCSPVCSLAARREHRRHSAQRYQGSRRGRLKHAARTACWRRRQRALCVAGTEVGVNKVTHQGCPPKSHDALLLACETTTACETIGLTSSAAAVVPAQSATVTWTTSRCRLCGGAVLPHIRQGWLGRRGVARGARHDHCP